MRRYALAVFVITVVVLVGWVPSAGAARNNSSKSDRRISITGGVVVASGETVDGPVISVDGPVVVDGTVNDDVYVANGRLVVRGHVTGDMLVVDGDVLITGRVGGDVVALDGRITVRADASVRGDVKSREQPDVAPGTVQGKVKKLDVANLFTGFLIAFLLYLWLATTVSVAIAGLLFVLLFPRAADASAAAGRRFWRTLGWGALIGIVGPLLGALVLVTIIGIPLGLATLSALNALAPLGYVASSLILGRLMVKGRGMASRIGAFFAGFGILRAAALIPGVGFIVWFLACIYGLGALTQAAWRAGRTRDIDAQGAQAPAIEEAPPAEDETPVTAVPAASTEPTTNTRPATPTPDE
jgi:cytoskeletal protein CcmA (bactofilin family)